LAVSDELAADQFVDFLFGQFRIKTPIELRQCGSFFEAGSLEAGVNQTGVSAVQLILHQAGEYLCKRIALIGLGKSGLQCAVHAVKAKSFEMLFDFRECHVHRFTSIFYFSCDDC